MQLYTIPELAKLVGVSRQWIWFLVRRKDLPAKKVGGVYIIRESDIPKSLFPNLNFNSQSSESKTTRSESSSINTIYEVCCTNNCYIF